MFLYRTGIILLLFVLGVNCEKKSENEAINIVNDTSIFVGANIEHIIDFNYIGVDFCESKYVPKKPNFTLSKRRISEVKCLDYIWTARNDQYEFDKKEFCLKKIIVGGRPAFHGEFPHMGALGWRSAHNTNEWVFKCGATLISDKFLVTAGHCIYVSSRDTTVAKREPEIVKIGDKFLVNEFPEENEKRSYDNFNNLELALKENRPISRISEDMKPKYIKISRIIKHENYKPPKKYYDIALIELEDPVQIGALIRPACLWSSLETSRLNKPSVSGWGVVDPASGVATTELQVAEISFINNEKCDEMLLSSRNRNWAGLVGHQICAGHLAGGIDTCQGDSGGPLQSQINLNQTWPMYYLVGVTSFGYGCARPGTPSIYTRIASFVDWIESIVWPNS